MNTHILRLSPGRYFSARRGYGGGAVCRADATTFSARDAADLAGRLLFNGRHPTPVLARYPTQGVFNV